ncbi:MAG: TPM domain-containing protein [Burkholderiaceae bacterium]
MEPNRLTRALRHGWAGIAGWRPVLAEHELAEIEASIAAGEQRHKAEIRVVIERALPPLAIWRRELSPRERALEVFAELHVWDTAANNGVLLYVSMADRQVEILADRGALAAVSAQVWSTACDAIGKGAASGKLTAGMLDGLQILNDALAGAFPGDGSDPNELRDRPLVR